jgi:hypothetical protein
MNITPAKLTNKLIDQSVYNVPAIDKKFSELSFETDSRKVIEPSDDTSWHLVAQKTLSETDSTGLSVKIDTLASFPSNITSETVFTNNIHKFTFGDSAVFFRVNGNGFMEYSEDGFITFQEVNFPGIPNIGEGSEIRMFSKVNKFDQQVLMASVRRNTSPLSWWYRKVSFFVSIDGLTWRPIILEEDEFSGELPFNIESLNLTLEDTFGNYWIYNHGVNEPYVRSFLVTNDFINWHRVDSGGTAWQHIFYTEKGMLQCRKWEWDPITQTQPEDNPNEDLLDLYLLEIDATNGVTESKIATFGSSPEFGSMGWYYNPFLHVYPEPSADGFYLIETWEGWTQGMSRFFLTNLEGNFAEIMNRTLVPDGIISSSTGGQTSRVKITNATVTVEAADRNDNNKTVIISYSRATSAITVSPWSNNLRWIRNRQGLIIMLDYVTNPNVLSIYTGTDFANLSVVNINTAYSPAHGDIHYSHILFGNTMILAGAFDGVNSVRSVNILNGTFITLNDSVTSQPVEFYQVLYNNSTHMATGLLLAEHSRERLYLISVLEPTLVQLGNYRLDDFSQGIDIYSVNPRYILGMSWDDVTNEVINRIMEVRNGAFIDHGSFNSQDGMSAEDIIFRNGNWFLGRHRMMAWGSDINNLDFVHNPAGGEMAIISNVGMSMGVDIMDIFPDFNEHRKYGNKSAGFKAYYEPVSKVTSLVYGKPKKNSRITHTIEISDKDCYKDFAPISDVNALGRELSLTVYR